MFENTTFAHARCCTMHHSALSRTMFDLGVCYRGTLLQLILSGLRFQVSGLRSQRAEAQAPKPEVPIELPGTTTCGGGLIYEPYLP